jgi:hypothetical protein
MRISNCLSAAATSSSGAEDRVLGISRNEFVAARDMFVPDLHIDALKICLCGLLFQSSWFRSQPHRRKTLKFDACTNSIFSRSRRRCAIEVYCSL